MFDRFLLLGTFEAIDDNGAVVGITPINSVRRGQLPLQQTLISFP